MDKQLLGSVGSVFASRAEMEQGTLTGKAVAPGTVQYHPGAPKFWVNFAGADGAINASHNVTSVAKNSTGNYTVTVATDFSSANWTPQVSIEISAQQWVCRIDSKTAGTVTIVCWSTVDNAAVDPTAIFVSGFGDQ